MYRIAVVEDEREQSALLVDFIGRFADEEGVVIETSVFDRGIDFISDYKGDFDIVFMDIEMPEMDGMETAVRLRKLDSSAVLVFVTNMAQYAIKGYEVNALDFVVKPVGYFCFAEKLRKAIGVAESHSEREFVIVRENDVVRVRASQIYYIEKQKNYLVFHTDAGDFTKRGTIAEMEEQVKGIGFSKCINGCLVNLRHVKRTENNSVWVKDQCLPISRQQRKVFVGELIDYYSGGGGVK